MTPRAWALLAAALAALCVAGWVGAAALATSRAPPSALEQGLAASGHAVSRGAATPLVGTTSPAPAVVALVKPPHLSAGETERLRAFVASGGELWILSPEPDLALWSGLPVGAYAGYVYAQDGSPARLTAGSASFEMTGARALRIPDGVPHSPLVTADEFNFRDTNANGKLEAGEPSGPFVIAAALPQDAGRVVLIAVDPATAGALPPAVYANAKPGTALVIDYEHPGAWAGPARALLALLALPQASAIAAGVALAAGLAAAALAWGDVAPRARGAEAPRATDALRRLEEKLAAERRDHPLLAILRERDRP